MERRRRVRRRIGEPRYFDSAAAKAIRAEGERLIKLVEAGDFPFDGTHTDFRPDPDWSLLRLSDDMKFPLPRPA